MRTGVERPKKGEARGTPGLVLNHLFIFTLLRGGGKGENGACDRGAEETGVWLEVPGMVAIFLESFTVLGPPGVMQSCAYSASLRPSSGHWTGADADGRDGPRESALQWLSNMIEK
jgi:hypothetical protein